MQKSLFLLILIFTSTVTLSQQKRIDSLKQKLSNLSPDDTSYVDVSNEIAFELSLTDPQRSIYYINLAISVAKELDYDRGLVRATVNKGSSFLIVGLPDQALVYYFEALSYNAEKYPFEYVRLTNNIGEVYRRKKVYDSSIAYFHKALDVVNAGLPGFMPAIIYSNLGEVSLMQGNVDKAKEYFDKCIIVSIDDDDKRGLAYGYYGLAECSFENGQLEEALDFQLKSSVLRNEISHQRGLIQSYLRLGIYYAELQNKDSSFYYWGLAEAVAKKNLTNDLLNKAYLNLYKAYLDESNIEKASFYLEKHHQLGDSLRNAEFAANINNMKAALESELIAAENRILRQKQQLIESEEDARLVVISLIFIVILVLVFITFKYKRKKAVAEEYEVENEYTRSLLLLSELLNSKKFKLQPFIRNLLAESREMLNTDRASYWTIAEDFSRIAPNELVVKPGVKPIPSREFSKDEFPNFFKEFLTTRTVAVSEVSKDRRLADIYEAYFKQVGIEAVLNAPVIINYLFKGFLSYSMTEMRTRDWTVQEQRYVGSLADLVVIATAKETSSSLEAEKEELIEKLQTKNKSLQEFNSVISHNLREPLTQIIGFSDLLSDKKRMETADFDEIILLISKASNRIDTVIKELSTVLNESEPEPSDFRIVSLEKLVKEATDLLKSEIKSLNAKIEVNLEVTKARTYKPFLLDVLYHLLANSLKYQKKDETPCIKIESSSNDRHYYITISDNGRGMDLTKFGDRIFKMYQRYHTDVDGRGLGLFIVRNRTISLGGYIGVESDVDKGTTIKLQFPKSRYQSL